MKIKFGKGTNKYGCLKIFDMKSKLVGGVHFPGCKMKLSDKYFVLIDGYNRNKVIAYASSLEEIKHKAIAHFF